uniref:Carboxylesterase type B domain-containing protein n=1 Tax=Timema bartmani TaxID=61472 RepID=A0A7R9HYU9_9NEOP|nr:unnamed protein product [Timema bartmani]
MVESLYVSVFHPIALPSIVLIYDVIDLGGEDHWDSVHPTEVRISISPFSAVELNTTSVLANYATEAGGFDPATITNERLLPRSLRENLSPGVSYDLGSKVKEFYFGDKTVCSETMDRYVKMLSDVYFLYNLFLTVKLQLKHTDCPVYAYQYDHKRPPQLDKLIPDFTKNVPGMFNNTARARDTGGAGHGEELIFLFLNSYIKPDFGAESSNAKVRSNMVKLWTNFSKTGDPNSSDFQVKWPQLTRDSFDFLNISPELTLLKDFAKDRMDFWEEIYLAGKKL